MYFAFVWNRGFCDEEEVPEPEATQASQQESYDREEMFSNFNLVKQKTQGCEILQPLVKKKTQGCEILQPLVKQKTQGCEILQPLAKQKDVGVRSYNPW